MRFPRAVNILGIDFFNGNVEELVKKIREGALLVIPAAPALSNIKNDPLYYESLLSADIAIADSGYMSLIWNTFHKTKIKRVSGLEFLTAFLNDKEIKGNSDILLVNPNADEENANLSYLHKIGFDAQRIFSYVSPLYAKTRVEDKALLEVIEARKPKYIIINLGGGIQEKLGAYLKKNLSYMPAVICSGAAIAFLTGKQARIPAWADKLYMGWLIRCFEKPAIYVPRYFKAFKLLFFMLRYREASLNPKLNKLPLSVLREQK